MADLTGGDNGGYMIAPAPRCPLHGQMHYRAHTRPLGGGVTVIIRSEWICHGWDGEGCGHAVSSDDLPWRPGGLLDDPDSEMLFRRNGGDPGR